MEMIVEIEQMRYENGLLKERCRTLEEQNRNLLELVAKYEKDYSKLMEKWRKAAFRGSGPKADGEAITEKREQFMLLRKDGYSRIEIIEKMNLSPSTYTRLMHWYKKFNAEGTEDGMEVLNEKQDKFRALKEVGCSRTEIMGQMNVSSSTYTRLMHWYKAFNGSMPADNITTDTESVPD